MNTAMTLPPETRLDVTTLAEAMVRDGRLSAKDLLRLRGMRQTAIHPLVVMAEQKLADPSLYDDDRVADLEVWSKKFAEVEDGLARAEGLWMTALETLETAEGA